MLVRLLARQIGFGSVSGKQADRSGAVGNFGGNHGFPPSRGRKVELLQDSRTATMLLLWRIHGFTFTASLTGRDRRSGYSAVMRSTDGGQPVGSPLIIHFLMRMDDFGDGTRANGCQG
jgi:hypothetical protein